MFKTKITKEEVNRLEIEAFKGEIVVVEKEEKVESAIQYLKKFPEVGFDTETKPSFRKGLKYRVSLVQISTPDVCFLFRLNKMGLPPLLSNYLGDKSIKKIGLSLRDDFNGLRGRHAFKPANFVDIQNIVQSYGILELGLQRIYAIIFDRKISKSQQLSNWENDRLTESQKCYAATDAWACLRIYLQLMQSEKLTKKQIEKLLFNIALEQEQAAKKNKPTTY
ncbi:MAG: 3'-5' exonuclease domain-containing protein 2 [Prevotellaceae bacterium]|jgi:ribonuclease D|nr:3'-5' exonuclease domain-containing protein 2 [Prevotellaceae bacterium]